MGHNLRTPLNSIIGFTGTLLMQLPGPLTADQQKHLRSVQAGGRQLLRMIDALVDIAKIETGRLPVRLEPVECESVARDIIGALRPQAQAKGLTLTLRSQLASGRTIRSDPMLLARILGALADNAVQYTGHGGVRIVLDESHEPGGGRPLVEFRVHDTGAGIPLAEQAMAFDGLARLAAGRRKHGEGAGLGLHLSAALAKLLGGRIDLHSESGRGSTFTMVLPEAPP